VFGRLPWLAFERRILALRFFVFLDMRDQPTGRVAPSTKVGRRTYASRPVWVDSFSHQPGATAMMSFSHYRQTWEELHHRRRTYVVVSFVGAIFLFFFIGLAIGWVAALLVPATYFFWLARFLNRPEPEASTVAMNPTGPTASTTSTIGPAGLGLDNERVEQRTTIVGRGMTREQMCAFINQRIEQHRFLRLSAEITTHPGQSGALLYTVTLDGHVPPPPQSGVSSSWLPP
jgi:hypothetical protein